MIIVERTDGVVVGRIGSRGPFRFELLKNPLDAIALFDRLVVEKRQFRHPLEAEALADLSQQTQFLLVTHNRGTIEAADTIYGVSMGEDGASKVLSLRLEELVED